MPKTVLVPDRDCSCGGELWATGDTERDCLNVCASQSMLDGRRKSSTSLKLANLLQWAFQESWLVSYRRVACRCPRRTARSRSPRLALAGSQVLFINKSRNSRSGVHVIQVQSRDCSQEIDAACHGDDGHDMTSVGR